MVDPNDGEITAETVDLARDIVFRNIAVTTDALKAAEVPGADYLMSGVLAYSRLLIGLCGQVGISVGAALGASEQLMGGSMPSTAIH